MPIKPGFGIGLAQGPLQRDAHGAIGFEAGIELTVDALHDRKLLDTGSELQIGEGVEAGILHGNGGLTTESGEQGEIFFDERQAVLAVHDLNDADDVVLDEQRHGEDRAGIEAGMDIDLAAPARRALDVILDDRRGGVYRAPGDAAASRQAMPKQLAARPDPW